jgi:hypothetical protein
MDRQYTQQGDIIETFTYALGKLTLGFMSFLLA